MINKLSISILIGILSMIATFYSFVGLEESQSMFEAINWSSPFWKYLYADEMLCTMAGQNKVMRGSIYTNGVLTACMACLTLWIRAREVRLKLR
jgi:hypothetical protein